MKQLQKMPNAEVLRQELKGLRPDAYNDNDVQSAFVDAKQNEVINDLVEAVQELQKERKGQERLNRQIERDI